MEGSHQDFFLAVAGVIPVLLLVIVFGESRITLTTAKGDPDYWIAGLLAFVIIGEFAALYGLAWPPGGNVTLYLATLGLAYCLMMIVGQFIHEATPELEGTAGGKRLIAALWFGMLALTAGGCLVMTGTFR